MGLSIDICHWVLPCSALVFWFSSSTKEKKTKCSKTSLSWVPQGRRFLQIWRFECFDDNATVQAIEANLRRFLEGNYSVRARVRLSTQEGVSRQHTAQSTAHLLFGVFTVLLTSSYVVPWPRYPGWNFWQELWRQSLGIWQNDGRTGGPKALYSLHGQVQLNRNFGLFFPPTHTHTRTVRVYGTP